MKSIVLILGSSFFLYSCGTSSQIQDNQTTPQTTAKASVDTRDASKSKADVKPLSFPKNAAPATRSVNELQTVAE